MPFGYTAGPALWMGPAYPAGRYPFPGGIPYPAYGRPFRRGRRFFGCGRGFSGYGRRLTRHGRGRGRGWW